MNGPGRGRIARRRRADPGRAAWLRLERKRQTVSLAQSADGTQWASISVGAVALDSPETAYAGLACDQRAARRDGHCDAVRRTAGVPLEPARGVGERSTSAAAGSQARRNIPNPYRVYWQLVDVVGNSRRRRDLHIPASQRRCRNLGEAASTEFGRRRRWPAGQGHAGFHQPDLWLKAALSGERTVQRRQAAGLAPATSPVGAGTIPGWLKLVRHGTMVSAYQSSDGSAWALLTTEAVELPDSIDLGLAVSVGEHCSNCNLR